MDDSIVYSANFPLWDIEMVAEQTEADPTT